MAIDRNAMDWFGRCKYITLGCLLYGLLQAPTLFGQVDQGSVSGIVQDASGAVVPNAKVTLLNKDVGLSLEATTKGSGEYIFYAGQDRELLALRYGSRICDNNPGKSARRPRAAPAGQHSTENRGYD